MPCGEILHAYALVPGPGVGQFFAVHLEGVRARKVTIIEPSKRPEAAIFGRDRLVREIDRRGCAPKGWEK